MSYFTYDDDNNKSGSDGSGSSNVADDDGSSGSGSGSEGSKPTAKHCRTVSRDEKRNIVGIIILGFFSTAAAAFLASFFSTTSDWIARYIRNAPNLMVPVKGALMNWAGDVKLFIRTFVHWKAAKSWVVFLHVVVGVARKRLSAQTQSGIFPVVEAH